MEKSYSLYFEKNAIKQISKIDKTQQVLLLSYIEKNINGTTEPRSYGGPLKGNLINYWRYRVGDYRIIAEINDYEVKILIIEVGHRKEIYHKLKQP